MMNLAPSLNLPEPRYGKGNRVRKLAYKVTIECGLHIKIDDDAATLDIADELAVENVQRLARYVGSMFDDFGHFHATINGPDGREYLKDFDTFVRLMAVRTNGRAIDWQRRMMWAANRYTEHLDLAKFPPRWARRLPLDLQVAAAGFSISRMYIEDFASAEFSEHLATQFPEPATPKE